MRKKPFIIQLVGWALIIAPIYYYITFFLVHSGTSFLDYPKFFQFNSNWKLAVVFLAPLVGTAVLSVRPIGWYAFIGYAIYTILIDISIYLRGYLDFKGLVFFSSTGVVAILVYLLRKEIMAPYFNPRLHWWKSAERFLFKLQVTIHKEGQADEVIQCQTFDISTSGCFIVTNHEELSGAILDFTIRLLEDVRLQGEVVWVNQGNPRIPKGIGIRFTSKQKEIKKMVLQFKKKFSSGLEENPRHSSKNEAVIELPKKE